MRQTRLSRLGRVRLKAIQANPEPRTSRHQQAAALELRGREQRPPDSGCWHRDSPDTSLTSGMQVTDTPVTSEARAERELRDIPGIFCVTTMWSLLPFWESKVTEQQVKEDGREAFSCGCDSGSGAQWETVTGRFFPSTLLTRSRKGATRSRNSVLVWRQDSEVCS